MFTFFIRLAFGYAALTRWYPSNLALAALRRRARLKRAVPVSIGLAIGYLALAVWLAWLVHTGAPGWVGVLAMIALISAVKFIAVTPKLLVLLIRVRWTERHTQALGAR